MKISPNVKRLIDSDRPWLTDGGFETSMVFLEGIDLPAFSSSVLLESEKTRKAASDYFDRFLGLAAEAGTGFVLDTASWRAGAHWAGDVGRTEAQMLELARESVRFAKTYRDANQTETLPIIVNGVIGPAGDGYSPDTLLGPGLARSLHLPQIRAMADEGVEMISGVTITYPDEAIGIVQASVSVGLPCVISFTVETDGRLPTGQSLPDAIAEVDAATDAAPLWYMVNCAHPDHFADKLAGDWLDRIGGVRANASRLSHAELDMAEELDDGDPEEFGALHASFATDLPALKVIGGCCGTDDRHVGCAARHVLKHHAHAA